MDDHAARSQQTCNGSLNEVLTGLNQHLYRHIVRNAALLNEAAVERELRIGGSGETNLDFLEAAFYQGIEHLQLLRDIHRHRQGLISIPQVDGAPDRSFCQGLVRPCAVRKMDRRKGAIFYRRILNHKKCYTMGGDIINRRRARSLPRRVPCRRLKPKNAAPPPHGGAG